MCLASMGIALLYRRVSDEIMAPTREAAMPGFNFVALTLIIEMAAMARYASFHLH